MYVMASTHNGPVPGVVHLEASQRDVPHRGYLAVELHVVNFPRWDCRRHAQSCTMHCVKRCAEAVHVKPTGCGLQQPRLPQALAVAHALTSITTFCATEPEALATRTLTVLSRMFKGGTAAVVIRNMPAVWFKSSHGSLNTVRRKWLSGGNQLRTQR